MRMPDFTPGVQLAQMCGAKGLASRWTELLDPRIKGLGSSLEGIQGERSRHVCGIDQVLGRQKRNSTHAEHPLGSIEQRDAFLGLEANRFELMLLECCTSGQLFPAEIGFTL